MSIDIIRKCCPRCGGRIIVSEWHQYSIDQVVGKNGKLLKKKKKVDCGMSECIVASCENSVNCDTSWGELDFYIDADGYFHDREYAKEKYENGI